MATMEPTHPDLPALIQAARQLYETEPVQAALLLYQGLHDAQQPVALADPRASRQCTPNHGENVLRTALWTLEVMAEEAQAGIVPTRCEWELNVSVAQSIIRMMEAQSDET